MTTVQELLTRLENLESSLNVHGLSLKQPAECKHGVQDNACIACYMDKTDQKGDDVMFKSDAVKHYMSRVESTLRTQLNKSWEDGFNYAVDQFNNISEKARISIELELLDEIQNFIEAEQKKLRVAFHKEVVEEQNNA